MTTPAETLNFKVVLLGEGCVGKTSILLRYVEDKFNENHLSTIQASFLVKKLNIDNKRINLSIWDTAGQEKFHALGPIYYRNSNGAILVYDITDEDSFQKVKKWVKELRKMLGTNIIITIVGNKLDLLESDAELPIEAQTYAESVGAKHFYTSAKLNKGIEQIFFYLTRAMIEKYEVPQANAPPGRSLQVYDDEETENNRTRLSCCSK